MIKNIIVVPNHIWNNFSVSDIKQLAKEIPAAVAPHVSSRDREASRADQVQLPFIFPVEGQHCKFCDVTCNSN